MKNHFGLRSRHLELEALLSCQRNQRATYFLHYVLKHDSFDGQVDLAGFDPGEIQQIVDKRQQVLGARSNGLKLLGLSLSEWSG